MNPIVRSELMEMTGSARLANTFEQLFEEVTNGATNGFVPIAKDVSSVLQLGVPAAFNSATDEGAIIVSEFVADGGTQDALFLGLMGVEGLVKYGPISGIDTTGIPQGESWSLGDVLYVSDISGDNYTTSPPAQQIVVGIIIKVDAIRGSIYVNRI